MYPHSVYHVTHTILAPSSDSYHQYFVCLFVWSVSVIVHCGANQSLGACTWDHVHTCVYILDNGWLSDMQLQTCFITVWGWGHSRHTECSPLMAEQLYYGSVIPNGDFAVLQCGHLAVIVWASGSAKNGRMHCNWLCSGIINSSGWL